MQLVVSPVTVAQVAPPGLAVTVYPVIGEPPLFGVVQLTVTCPIPAVPETLVATTVNV